MRRSRCPDTAWPTSRCRNNAEDDEHAGKISIAQRSQLFHAAVQRVVRRDMHLKRIDIELYVQNPVKNEQSGLPGAVFGEESTATAVRMPFVTVGGI